MLLKILALLLVCLIPLQAYQEHNGVLILTNDDLNNITDIFPHLFIKFYVPWCRHCQQLAPIFEQIAKDLQAQNSTIRLAKIDCEENEKAFQFQNLEHYPTLVFYDHGKKLDFDGDRTKNYISKWLTKRLVSPVKQITLEQLEQMRNLESEDISIVFHGELQSVKGSTFTNVAYQDNYNNYYFIKEHTKPYGTVQLLRSFADDVECPYPDDEFQYWISEHDRPSVIPLDDRSISSVFRDGRLGVLIFLQDKNSAKISQFKSAADAWRNEAGKRRFNFIHVPESHEDFYGLLEYMDVNPLENPITIIDAESQKKYVMNQSVTNLTAQKILEFLEDFEAGKITSSSLESQHSHHHHDHQHDHDHHHHHDHDHDHDHHHHHDHDHDHHHHHDHDHDHHDHSHHNHHHDHHHDQHDHNHHHHHPEAHEHSHEQNDHHHSDHETEHFHKQEHHQTHKQEQKVSSSTSSESQL